jgi:adenine-specific DNA methylase
LRAALLDFIADFSNWDNSTVSEYLQTSRLLVQTAHECLGGEPGSRPLVVDPFAGGGAIPLESLRCGADTFASDLNPIPVLLNKVVTEYLPKYGDELYRLTEKWGHIIKTRAVKSLSMYYPKGSDGSQQIAYLWARVVKCEGPNCGAEIPLTRTNWLSRRKTQEVAFQFLPKGNKHDVVIIEKKNKKWTSISHNNIVIESPKLDGTVKRGYATCPCCGFTTPVLSVRRQLKEKFGGAKDSKLISVVNIIPSEKGRQFSLPTKKDLSAIRLAEEKLKEMIARHGSDIVPTEKLPVPKEGREGTLGFGVQGYGMDTWDKIFTNRQLLALTEYSRLVNELTNEWDIDDDLGVAVKICLSFVVDRVADRCSSLCRYDPSPTMSGINNTFSRQAVSMIWDFAEGNPTSERSGGWEQCLQWVLAVLKNENDTRKASSVVVNCDATKHPLSDDSVDCYFTDPPYYDSVPYADLSDFFIVWLKRSLGRDYTKLFNYDLSLKEEECIVDELKGKNKSYFINKMESALSEGRRILKPSGIGIIVFAHKSTTGWEAQLQAMIDAGWTITGSWPIDTEMTTRLRAHNSAVLASSIHLNCRPRENPDGSLRIDEIGDWRDVLSELPKRIHEWMPRLAEEGVVGADAIFACLGPALEIYSRYSSVEKASGEKVELKEYLEEVWAAVSREAMNMIFEGADASGFEADARLTAMWLWTLKTTANGDEEEIDDSGTTKSLTGYSLEYDAARKIAQGLGAHLDNLSHLVETKGDTAILLSAETRTRYLFGMDTAEVPKGKRKKKVHPQDKFYSVDGLKQIDEKSLSIGMASDDGVGEISSKAGSTVLDQLHQSMILFATGRGEAMKRFLVEEGVGRKQLFWRLANALSALYPIGTDEKRWVDGVLARKKGLGL